MIDLQVIKRDNTEIAFDKSKIQKAVEKAGATEALSVAVADTVTSFFETSNNKFVKVEDIQDEVEKTLIHYNKPDIARDYIRYRYKREIVREHNKSIQNILGIINGTNEYAMTENSNKNPVVISTQRDYIAGETNKFIARTLLLPKEVVNAHDEGVIHQHDLDYTVGHIFNCALINLEDMLQNGTVITGNKIDKPKHFLTACNIATQVMAQCASNQLGGQTESLAHLAPFVNESRKYIRKQLEETGLEGEQLEKTTEKLLKDEIKAGVQTIQYQINTLNVGGLL